jgi:hypothetical protein
MMKQIADMPPGTLGFVASGKLSRRDYTDVAIPPLREAIDRGEKLRTLYQIDSDFHGIDWAGLDRDAGRSRCRCRDDAGSSRCARDASTR